MNWTTTNQGHDQGDRKVTKHGDKADFHRRRSVKDTETRLGHKRD